MDGSSAQKIDKETLVLNDTADQLDLINKKKKTAFNNSRICILSSASPGEENGYPLQHSCPENSMDRGAWQATVHGS